MECIQRVPDNDGVGANLLLFEEEIPHLTSNLDCDVEGEQWVEYVFFI